MKRNLLSDSVSLRKDHSSIFSLSLSGKIISDLQQSNVVFTSRNGAARVSFHYYNSETDLSKLLQIIDG